MANARLAKELVEEHLRGAIAAAMVDVADEVLKALEAVLTTAKDRAALASVGQTVREALGDREADDGGQGTGDGTSDDELERTLMAELSK